MAIEFIKKAVKTIPAKWVQPVTAFREAKAWKAKPVPVIFAWRNTSPMKLLIQVSGASSGYFGMRIK